MKFTKYIFWVFLVLLLGYFSITIRPIGDALGEQTTFDAEEYAENFLKNVLPNNYDNAIPLNELVAQLKIDSDTAFQKWSNAIALGDVGYFLISTSGTVSEINENEVLLVDRNNIDPHLQTEFIYGNAIRDASGLIDNKEFQNTSDLNALAAALNEIVRNEMIPPFLETVKLGDSVVIIGAVEMNKKFPSFSQIEIQPIQIRIQ